MTDHAHTLLILTDEESRILRHALDRDHEATGADMPLIAFNRGVVRGTEQLAREFAEKQRAKRR